jgi:low affinity Fe/Cu permease
VDTWQVIINTLTAIVTFLLVALLQNTQKRSDSATQHKLNAIAADVMYPFSEEHRMLSHEREELIASVGLEPRESAS